MPSDGETPWDQRLCDAFMEMIRSSSSDHQGRTTASPYFVVAHVPLEALVDDSGESSALAGELERDGLISTETVQEIACDATIAIGVDDDVGHTMYEGRARRTPSDAQRREVKRRDRHCRFPGCTNVTFTNVHHIVPWKPGGRTDLDNIALALSSSSSRRALQGLDHDRQRQRGAHLHRPEGPGHDLAPLATLGPRHIETAELTPLRASRPHPAAGGAS